jgi:myxalamid-type polyketide synthase MxaB
MIPPEMGVQIMQRLLNQDLSQAAVLLINWKLWQNTHPEFRELPMLTGLIDMSLDSAPIENDSQRLSAKLLLSAEPATRTDLLQSYLRQQVCRILGLTKDNLELEHPLTNMGLDSLMALELKNRIENDLEVAMPMVEFLRGPNLIQLSELVLSKVALGDPNHPVMQPTQSNGGRNGSHSPQEDAADLLAQIDQLSEEEINALLNEYLPEEKHPSS